MALNHMALNHMARTVVYVITNGFDPAAHHHCRECTVHSYTGKGQAGRQAGTNISYLTSSSWQSVPTSAALGTPCCPLNALSTALSAANQPGLVTP